MYYKYPMISAIVMDARDMLRLLISLLKKLLHNQGNYKQGEKTAFRLGENNSKWRNRQRINLKNVQATPAAQF